MSPLRCLGPVACLLASAAILTADETGTDVPLTLSQHKYFFENVVFDDGGTIEGWFIYDADAGIIVNSQVITTPATDLTFYERQNYQTGQLEQVPEFQYDRDYSGSSTVSNPRLIQFGVYNAYINLSLADSLADTGERINFVTGSDLSGSYEAVQVLLYPSLGFGAYSPIYTEARDLISGSLTTQLSAVPEPSTYATLAALGALGFAAYRRRRPAVSLSS